jgi:hypothetical protein
VPDHGEHALDDDALKEVGRLQWILRRIEDTTNSNGEHDSDYSAVCNKVNTLV